MRLGSVKDSCILREALRPKITKDELIAFETEVEAQFIAGNIKGPIHLSGGNEDQLIEIFKDIKRDDWVFSTWRNHFHALLHGVPKEELMAEIMAGRNMNFSSKKHNFFTSAIVGGILPIATGVAYALKKQGKPNKVWCFVGDMAAMSGIFHEARQYSEGHDLPITFVIEENGWSANTPTERVWQSNFHFYKSKQIAYNYERAYPHAGASTWVNF